VLVFGVHEKATLLVAITERQRLGFRARRLPRRTSAGLIQRFIHGLLRELFEIGLAAPTSAGLQSHSRDSQSPERMRAPRPCSFSVSAFDVGICGSCRGGRVLLVIVAFTGSGHGWLLVKRTLRKVNMVVIGTSWEGAKRSVRSPAKGNHQTAPAACAGAFLLQGGDAQRTKNSHVPSQCAGMPASRQCPGRSLLALLHAADDQRHCWQRFIWRHCRS
jgi:hypothetical protein